MDIKDPAIPGLLNDPFSPEVFALGASGFFVLNGNIAITFETARSDYSHEPPIVNRVVVGRIVLPIAGAQALAAGLNDFLTKQGLDPSTAITAGATKQ